MMTLPQPSLRAPHSRPAESQVAGAHSQALLLHANPGAHWPQSRIAPHPLGDSPHSASASAQLTASQPHTLSSPAPPQVFGFWQVPQFSMPPQPFETLPQFLLCAWQVVAVQPH
jgi:hypothetical protein